MANNSSLHRAKDAKYDEFYTQLTDVSKELIHYKQHFKDKVVFCNCNDPTWSAFWKYFHLNFKELGLKKLISTHYDKKESTYKMEYDGGNDNDIEAGIKISLEGNGDFRNKECLKILDTVDIVVTNPPFSLFREYIAQLIQYKKQFLIIGNKNAVTYKDFFSLLKSNQVWFGYNSPTFFILPDGTHTKKVTGLTRWFTNIDHAKRHQMLPLDLGCTYKNYNEQYPKYDNYNAIEVNRVQKIPCDYRGVMGVPPTFFDKYCPEQFEILGKTALLDWANSDTCTFFTPPSKELQEYYKSLDKTWRVQNAYILVEGKPLNVYDRIFIKFTSSYIQAHPEQFNQEDY